MTIDRSFFQLGVFCLFILSAANLDGQTGSRSHQESEFLSNIEPMVEREIARGNFPGCVVLIGKADQVRYKKAFGHLQIQPNRIEMPSDAIFDLASLTKPIATASSIMKLVEDGQIDLDEKAAKYWKAFAANGKEEITVRQLLLHTSGLIADNSLRDYSGSYEQSMEKIAALKLVAEPGDRFIYSDVGFIVLAELVRRITGKNVASYAGEKIFEPLGMNRTRFKPPSEWRERIAPTEKREGKWLRGEVHDPRSFRLGGVAGHAGLFANANDLARYAQMIVAGGRAGEQQIFQPETLAKMMKPHRVAGGVRALGWDMQTGFSSNRGDLFSKRAIGHGGFTGTGVWIDPETGIYVIFLSSRLHPDGKGSVNRLIGRIGTVAVAALERHNHVNTPPNVEVKTGLDVLIEEKFRRLKGKRIGLIANQTAISSQGLDAVKVFAESEAVELTKIFTPEHGFAASLEGQIADGKDPRFEIPILSLYGKTRKPNASDLTDVDCLVFDIQDAGSRYYTYISTMFLAMQAAAENDKEFFVLDRPNPINGLAVDGPSLDVGRESFVGIFPMPIRHGMTIGEIAQMFNASFKKKCRLRVVKMKNWKRAAYFDQTGLKWMNPSPNLRNLDQAVLYSGIGFLETTNLSVGRGTDEPFEKVGAPWLDGKRLARSLNGLNLPGIRFMPIEFVPSASKFKGEKCHGVQLSLTSRKDFQAFETGLAIAEQLVASFPEQWERKSLDRLLGNRRVYEAIDQGKDADWIRERVRMDVEKFKKQRAPFLLYDVDR